MTNCLLIYYERELVYSERESTKSWRSRIRTACTVYVQSATVRSDTHSLHRSSRRLAHRRVAVERDLVIQLRKIQPSVLWMNALKRTLGPLRSLASICRQ